LIQAWKSNWLVQLDPSLSLFTQSGFDVDIDIRVGIGLRTRIRIYTCFADLNRVTPTWTVAVVSSHLTSSLLGSTLLYSTLPDPKHSANVRLARTTCNGYSSLSSWA
jgi:hypothetical protein